MLRRISRPDTADDGDGEPSNVDAVINHVIRILENVSHLPSWSLFVSESTAADSRGSSDTSAAHEGATVVSGKGG